MDKLKELVLEQVEVHRAELVDLSLRIHHNPEVGLQEVRASGWIAEYLESKGFEVERRICELPTAFRAAYGQGSPVIAYMAEYDALPALGHACGHNIIAGAAVGAAVAVRPAVDQLGGTVLVIGTPSEEVHGSKQTLLDRGAFAGVEAAMMVHPGTRDLATAPALACSPLEVEFFGRAAHAAAYPEQGINALDALILSFNNINALRQHIKSSSRIHGIIAEGGEAPNIVPAYSKGLFLVRTDDLEYLEELKDKVLDCFVAASLATGARLEYRWGEVTYAPLRPNSVLAELFMQNMALLGRGPYASGAERGLGSTDMGNVSQLVPSLHPFVAIASPDVLEHSPEFAAAAASETGMQGLVDGAKALALTGIDLLASVDLLDRVKEDFLAVRELSSK